VGTRFRRRQFGIPEGGNAGSHLRDGKNNCSRPYLRDGASVVRNPPHDSRRTSRKSWRTSERPIETPFSQCPIVEITFTKWIAAYPALAGFTSYGPSTIAGAVLNRIDDGVFTHLSARYEITDPSGSHSFKAVIQGKGTQERQL